MPPGELAQTDASLGAPLERAGLVHAEIDPVLAPEELEDGTERFGRRLDLVRLGPLGGNVGVLCVGEQDARHLLGRQDVIDDSGADRVPRHAVVFGRLGILCDAQAACLAHGLDARGAVVPRTGHHDRRRAVLLIFGQRSEERVDRLSLAEGIVLLLRVEHPLSDLERRVGSDDVDVIRLDPLLVDDLQDLHRGGGPEDLGDVALAGGVEVHHDDEGHPALGRHLRQKALARLEPPGGRPDADDQAWCIRTLPVAFVLSPSLRIDGISHRARPTHPPCAAERAASRAEARW